MIPGHVADTLKRQMSIKTREAVASAYGDVTPRASSFTDALLQQQFLGGGGGGGGGGAGGGTSAATSPRHRDLDRGGQAALFALEAEIPGAAAMPQGGGGLLSALRPPNVPKTETIGCSVAYKQWHPEVSILFAGKKCPCTVLQS